MKQEAEEQKRALNRALATGAELRRVHTELFSDSDKEIAYLRAELKNDNIRLEELSAAVGPHVLDPKP